ncbi:hypothetical protein B0H19DRAFT_1072229 [Mycena capillaripes]|nr:hypothetical protein B0H19DRAFT_1072229 [Mycena capillaripes]
MTACNPKVPPTRWQYTPIVANLRQHSLDEHCHRGIFTKFELPITIYQLSRKKAINRGYWTGDLGDVISTAMHPNYGNDPNQQSPPLQTNCRAILPILTAPNILRQEPNQTPVFINDNDEISEGRDILEGLGGQ